MPRRRGSTRAPVDYLEDPTVAFVDGDLAPDAPVEARVAQAIARNVAASLDGRALIRVCADADLNRSTVQDLVAGRSYCDIVTVAKLQAVLGVELWPSHE